MLARILATFHSPSAWAHSCKTGALNNGTQTVRWNAVYATWFLLLEPYLLYTQVALWDHQHTTSLGPLRVSPTEVQREHSQWSAYRSALELWAPELPTPQ